MSIRARNHPQASFALPRRGHAARALGGVALLGAALVACDGNDGDGVKLGPPRFEITATGSGEASAAPLLPLRPGATWFDNHGEVEAHVGRPTRLGDLTVLPVSGNGQVDWYQHRDEGVFFCGNSHTGPKPRPLLWMPATVRVGMRWQAWFDGDEPVLGGEVLAVEERDTMWGRRKVWQIKRWDPRNPKEEQNAVPRDYAEGCGRVGGGLTGAVLPLEEQELAAPPRLAVTPLDGGKALLEGRWLYHVSMVDDGRGKGLRVRLDAKWAMRDLVAGVWQVVDAAHCLRLDEADSRLAPIPEHEEVDDKDEVCPDAAAVTFDADGELVIDPVAYGGALRKPPEEGVGQLYGGLLRIDGEPKAFVASRTAESQREDHIRWGWGDVGGAESDGGVRNLLTGDAFLPLKRRRDENLALQGVADSLALPAEVERAGFGLAVRFDAELGFARFDGRTLRDASSGVVLGGDLSSTVAAGERRFFATTFDGRVDEIVPTPEGLQTRHLADLALPAGHALAGAFARGGTLYAFTVAGQDPQAHSGVWEPQIGDVYAFEAKLDAPAPLAAPTPPAGAVRAAVTEADVEVCWPRGAGKPSTEGWTLAGEPATARPSRHDDSCVIVLRPFDSAVDLQVDGAYHGEGPVPGVGRVAFAFHGPEIETELCRDSLASQDSPAIVADPIAGVDEGAIAVATSDGGAVSPRFSYSPAGLVDGVPPNAEFSGFGYTVPMFADLAGGGVWHIGHLGSGSARCLDDGDEGPCTLATFTGATTGLVGVSGRKHDGNAAIVSAAGGGGVLIRWQDEGAGPMLYSHLRADGTFTDLPSSSLGRVQCQGIDSARIS